MMRIFRRSSGGSAVSPSYVGSVVPLHTSPGGEKNQNKTKQNKTRRKRPKLFSIFTANKSFLKR